MLAGPLLMCALLLGVAGLAKLAVPTPARAALYAVGLPSSTMVVIVLGLVEVLVAASVFTWGGRLPAAAVALAYAGFAGFIALGRSSGRLTNCGCFGAAGSPPSGIHIAFNLVAAAVSAAAVAAPIGAIDQVLADQPWSGVPFMGLVLLGAALSYTVLTVLPEALVYVGSRQPARGGSS